MLLAERDMDETAQHGGYKSLNEHRDKVAPGAAPISCAEPDADPHQRIQDAQIQSAP